ncbi:hypothetical protein J3R83DRAFT_11652 [Lanmaoa asiatica]|nr:hypothetical protein J3R83DRAFT_11652 [Lanmaoa asiatica]
MEWLPLKMFSRKPRTEYVVLPTDPQPAHSWTPHLRRRRCRIAHVITLRRLLFCLACTPIFVFLAILCQGIPPSYDDVRTFERRLPQHSVAALTHPGGRPARYLRFPGHLWGHGLNNILQEACVLHSDHLSLAPNASDARLLMSYLAYVSNVSFVFEDYTWSHIPLPWTLYGLTLRPTRIPINAIISGPTAGGPMPDAPHAPLAVSAEFYEHVCSGPAITPYVLSSANAPNDADGAVVIDWWRNHLSRVDTQCIEIDSSAHDLFDRFLFGGPRVLSLFDSLAASPILHDFTWSPLVQSAIARNFALLQPRSAKHIFASDLKATLDGLVAVHLRRGDYVRHCPNLAKWGADYMGINQHPSLLDRFDPSPLVNDTAAKEAYYLEHCLPTTSRLVARLHEIRAQHPGLRRVYVLSNEWAWALSELKDALAKDGWSDLVSTVDVQLDAEQYHVSMAVDMAIAERAEVFVGNGFSSLSSNVVMLRLAKGMDPSTNRFL